MPTLHITNFARRALHTDRVYSIMRAPRPFELGAGHVSVLRPSRADLDAVRNGEISMETYRERFLSAILPLDLSPGRLLWSPWGEGASQPVEHGATLCCACSTAQAKQGRCHRVWAAHELYAQGWSIVLDGAPYDPKAWPGRGTP